MSQQSTYRELLPSPGFDHLIDSFWNHVNTSGKPQTMTIVPDSFFKIVFLVKNNQVVKYFLTGLWTENKDFTIPANGATYGCRLKILAPEYLLQSEIASIVNSVKQLDLEFLNVQALAFSDFDLLVRQWEAELMKLVSKKEIAGNKQRLSELLYDTKGELTVSEVSDQIFWTARQINRYLNRWVGISLKSYLNIQKCYQSYLHIRQGQFLPETDYFDQSHFIREVKKHTGETPSKLFQKQNDRFIQLKNIKEK